MILLYTTGGKVNANNIIEGTYIDLEGVDLSSADLQETTFHGGLFGKAIFRGAIMEQTSFSMVSLPQANFDKTIIDNSKFLHCDLSGATWNNAEITNSEFHGSSFRDTDFDSMVLWSVSFNSIDLSLAKGLENVKFIGPSSLGVDTLYKSGGNIPESFLRGCGVPDDFITFYLV
jgi:uncharacterized protein YjbI with pentapeptide repeats